MCPPPLQHSQQFANFRIDARVVRENGMRKKAEKKIQKKIGLLPRNNLRIA